ncbi:S9 family peptidase [Treponema sp. OMZ 792]|uniref:prolyl oligopeptidase family serine peptidase n=1 Tax=unclassified Treponema TaxID=2638727 RepID=UPI0020A267C5|nr:MULTISPECIES: prolyl oligopeptidase family serine peptidase [unclassified Treponema]UTC74115.1 S9 family peptidase [Treponema sp. OMZ 792]UTC77602.1 S9 family peptidase [Treponema sp. OMZ 799]UTC80515.1 S9 family peptidase [Treponema sp. OMZ 798]
MQYKQSNVSDNYFGTIVADPYRWLEDDNAPEVIAWVKEENKKTEEFLSKIPFRAELKKRLEEIWDYEKRSGLFKAGDFYYFFRTEGLQNQSIMYRQKGQEKAESSPEVFFDPNTLSPDGTIALKNIAFSKDGKYMAYSVSGSGSDWEEIFVFDAEKKTGTEEHIHWVKFSNIAWYKDGFFYSSYDAPDKGKALTEKNEFQKLKYHKLGTKESEDILIFEDKEHPLRSFSASTTEDEKTILVTAFEVGNEGSMLFVADLSEGLPKSFKQYNTHFNDNVWPLETDNRFLYLLTNHKSPLYRIIKTPLNAADEKNIEEVIPEQDCLLSSAALCGGKLLTVYLRDVQDEVFIHDLNGKNKTRVDLPKNGSIGFSGARKNEDLIFFNFTSYTTPNKIIRYDIKTNSLKDFFVPAIPIDTDLFKCEQVFFKSKDGTKIPMHIVSKKDIKLDGNNPTLMYGYGGFAISLPPAFSPARMAFLEKGGIFVCVNLRGGLEYGEEWHSAGKKMKKQNVFDDFISAGEYLIEQKYTSNKKLAIQGGSNGGLLIGAVTNRRPDLFAVAIPQVGVLDMLRYQHFTIGWAWVDEYGSSEDSKDMFEYLYAYSPLHNVKAGIDYPSIMVCTGDHDDRVVPAHSFKYAQALQDTYKGENPILIRITEKAGHGAGKPTAKIIEETADIYAFIFKQTGHKI